MYVSHVQLHTIFAFIVSKSKLNAFVVAVKLWADKQRNDHRHTLMTLRLNVCVCDGLGLCFCLPVYDHDYVHHVAADVDVSVSESVSMSMLISICIHARVSVCAFLRNVWNEKREKWRYIHAANYILHHHHHLPISLTISFSFSLITFRMRKSDITAWLRCCHIIVDYTNECGKQTRVKQCEREREWECECVQKWNEKKSDNKSK